MVRTPSEPLPRDVPGWIPAVGCCGGPAGHHRRRKTRTSRGRSQRDPWETSAEDPGRRRIFGRWWCSCLFFWPERFRSRFIYWPFFFWTSCVVGCDTTLVVGDKTTTQLSTTRRCQIANSIFSQAFEVSAVRIRCTIVWSWVSARQRQPLMRKRVEQVSYFGANRHFKIIGHFTAKVGIKMKI